MKKTGSSEVSVWLPRDVHARIIGTISAGEVPASGMFTCDGFAVFEVGSPAWANRPVPMMPAGNFVLNGKEYAVYFK